MSLDDRVVLVTGAGGGLGRAHAWLLAQLGAKVVVNDLGTMPDGAGTNRRAAEAVVAEITASGGVAVANCDSVSDFRGARSMINQALDEFGDLHVVVNNAGIVRDGPLVQMAEEDFDDVVRVHLKGTFNTSLHAAEHWRRRFKTGDTVDRAIINTSSASGLHGSALQANYAAAKAGVAAMTLVAAKELARYGVRANCVVPLAATRLTAQASSMQVPLFDPANVSPLVACLAASSCDITGRVFSAHGGSVGVYAGWSIAAELTTEGRWSVDRLAAALPSLPDDDVGARTQLDVLNRVVFGAID